MSRLLIVSFDAVGDDVFERLSLRPEFSRLLEYARVRRGVDSVFLSNTYPVHTSVATGVVPGVHGLVSNTEPFPKPHPKWCYLESGIRAPTLWQTAARHGLSVAAVLWPVTGGSKTIRWNIPELLIQPGENQVLLNLKYGSKLVQIKEMLRHGKLLDGINQPALDCFAAACMADILREKNPDLALVHLTAYDTLCHHYGPDSPELELALDSLDANLGRLLDVLGDGEVILFSDHSQLPVENAILPNDLLVSQSLLARDGDSGEYIDIGEGCFFECCAGSGFFHPGRLSPAEISAVREAVTSLPGFGRFLTGPEMIDCGREKLPFGFAAAPGYAIEAHDSHHKGNHGYPLDYASYKVFYLHAKAGLAPKSETGGSLLDIAELAKGILGIG